MKKYEIALLCEHGYDGVKTYEYETIYDMQQDLMCIVEHSDAPKIELSILDQDEDGSNNVSYTFCEIDLLEMRKMGGKL